MLSRIFNTTRKKENFEKPVPKHGGKAFEVNNWLISEFVVEKLVPVVGVHPFPLNEQMLMTSAVCWFEPDLIFEWGTNIGKSARIFYEITKAFRIPAAIHSIDLPDDVDHNEHPRNDRGILVRNIPEVKLHQADGLTRSFEIIKSSKDGSRVLFFVDGDHSYESVKRELTAILDGCPSAAILLHDTFNQTEESGYNTGPYRAIEDTLTARKGGLHKLSTGFGLPGMTFIYP